MTERISPSQLHVVDWRLVRDGASTHFRTESLAQGIELVEAIGTVADATDLQTDIDLRSNGVTVHIRKPVAGDQRLRDGHVALARQISAAARERKIPVDLSGLQIIQIAIDALVIPEVMPFWRAVLGYVNDGDEDLLDPHWESPPLWFQQMDKPRPQRNRIHIDLYVPHDEAEARVAAAIAAGGHMVNDENAPEWWTLADAEGNEVDVAPWPDLD